MAKTILQLWLATPSEAWYQMSKEEQDSLMAKHDEAYNKAGGKSIVMANSAWSNEKWMFFGVSEYPDIEAVQKHAKDLVDMNWLRYIDSKVVLGTEWEAS
jgi:hypothetical protein